MKMTTKEIRYIYKDYLRLTNKEESKINFLDFSLWVYQNYKKLSTKKCVRYDDGDKKYYPVIKFCRFYNKFFFVKNTLTKEEVNQIKKINANTIKDFTITKELHTCLRTGKNYPETIFRCFTLEATNLIQKTKRREKSLNKKLLNTTDSYEKEKIKLELKNIKEIDLRKETKDRTELGFNTLYNALEFLKNNNIDLNIKKPDIPEIFLNFLDFVVF